MHDAFKRHARAIQGNLKAALDALHDDPEEAREWLNRNVESLNQCSDIVGDLCNSEVVEEDCDV
tara:strand:+ start:13222 stop:13413 length:192 start_codon:yes stop_codon:yes gene_type:complete